MKKTPPWFVGLAALLSLVLWRDSASSSVSIEATVEDLAKTSELVALVTPIQKTSAWHGERIVTITRVRVDDVVAADRAGADARELDIRTLGGVVGDVGQSVAGEAAPAVGQPGLAFLGKRAKSDAAYFVVARAQGYFPVVTDRAGNRTLRASAVDSLVARPTRAPLAAPSGPKALSLSQRPLADALEVIRSAWRAVRAK